jgi:hypothetical protein
MSGVLRYPSEHGVMSALVLAAMSNARHAER